jgi:predicted TIM-barrel fold metal-dependent hydrolase
MWAALPNQRACVVSLPQGRLSNMRIIANFCLSNHFDRFPKLKIASVESGLGWVPFLLECLEHEFDEMVTDHDQLTYAKRRPIEYFRDHFTVAFAFEEVGPTKLIEDIGVNNVLVESDWPHSGAVYPGFRKRIMDVTKELDPHVQRRLLQDNASELYRIDVS